MLAAGAQLTKWRAIDAETKPYKQQQCLATPTVYPLLEGLRPGTLDEVMSYWGVGFTNAHVWAEEFPVSAGTGLRYSVQDKDGNTGQRAVK